tara:strand:+ start:625 stop:1065 length:441 start_codon:yes stop_codon:yes gene_type:complete
MIEPLLISSSLLIGKEVMTQTITNSTKNIYSGIEKIITNENTEFNLILDKLDINTKLDIINSFITEMENSNKLLSETTSKALKYIEKILKTIELEISNINTEIIEHKKKWFNRIRPSNCREMINNLINHVAILDNRFELLIKFINI